MQKAYGNEALNQTNIFMWYFRSLDGRDLVEYDESVASPKSNRTEVSIDVVADMVQKDRRIEPRMIAESFYILKKNLERKII